jgi:putative DNA primase/helicase
MNVSKRPSWSAGANEISTPSKQPNFKQVKQVAHGLWLQTIFPALNVPSEYLSLKNIKNGLPCPNCGGRDRFSLTDWQGNGDYHCRGCGAGDGFEFLRLLRGWTKSEALSAVAGVLGWHSLIDIPVSFTTPVIRQSASPQVSVDSDAVRYNKWLRKTSRPVSFGDPVDLYLKRRGLSLLEYPEVLRYHPCLTYHSSEGEILGRFPAMVAIVQNPEGRMVALHRTYLTMDGHKAPVPKAKKQTKCIFPGAISGGAVRLFPQAEVMGVAEGIETAIACCLLYGIATWAALSAEGLKSIVLPDSVKHVLIAVDNDPESRTGEKKSLELSKRLEAEGRTYQRIMPEQPGFDLADYLFHGETVHAS